MERFRHVLVGLTREERDVNLIQYAAMLARLDTAVEMRFAHVLPNGEKDTEPADHDSALADVEKRVAEAFLNVPDSVKVYCDVLKGPLVDRSLSFAAEQAGPRLAGPAAVDASALLRLDRPGRFTGDHEEDPHTDRFL